MSGGHFNYNQYHIDDIVEEIRNIIQTNGIKDENGWGHSYSDNTIDEFKNAIEMLELGRIYAQRIDWLHSGDDGEENFHKRLNSDINDAGYELRSKK